MDPASDTTAPASTSTTDEPTTTPPQDGPSSAPAVDGTSATTTEATPEADGFHELSFDDLPEEALPYARQVEAQLKAAYTRKTQELASARREAEQALELRARLGSEETREQALAELLDEHGYELATDDEDIDDELDEEAQLRKRLDDLEAERTAERQAREQAALTERIEEVVDDAFSAYEAELGHDLPERDRRMILVSCSALTQPGELPNMEAAVAEHRAWTAEIAQRAITDYLASKRVPNADASGPSGVHARQQPKTRQERDALALEVVGRHYSGAAA